MEGLANILPINSLIAHLIKAQDFPKIIGRLLSVRDAFVAVLEMSTFQQDELVGFKPGLINQEFFAQIIFLTIGTG